MVQFLRSKLDLSERERLIEMIKSGVGLLSAASHGLPQIWLRLIQATEIRQEHRGLQDEATDAGLRLQSEGKLSSMFFGVNFLQDTVFSPGGARFDILRMVVQAKIPNNPDLKRMCEFFELYPLISCRVLSLFSKKVFFSLHCTNSRIQ